MAKIVSRAQRAAGDRGITTLEAVITLPVIFTVILSTLHVSILLYERNVATATAQEAAQAARAYGATPGAAQLAAEQFLDNANGRHALSNVQVSVSSTATDVTVTVSGDSLQVVPFLPVHVVGTSTGPIERFVPQA